MDFRELGQTIARLRKEQNISQNKLCEDIGISRATLSSFENARGIDIGLRKVLQIIDYLGYKIDLQMNTLFPSFEELRDE
ncbi:helix-turn-helix transcriptional regulator [Sulfurimonas sp. SAG-AH-194-C20]|nr:helix-turn-helix transcriptional regulator [Sulfurimonas sp. SAG-AH-194-C20]MDF1879629.1 helix-turn-helix transcriptional regulator [Sulfurimonas sp. SAG-AH-194-C20]